MVIEEKQNKGSTGPENAVKLYGGLKMEGKTIYKYECTALNLIKGKLKLSLGLLVQIYGKHKKWKELSDEIKQEVADAREKRGAGQAPV